MLSHHTWSPRAPLINVVAQCMPASEPKWLFFLKAFRSKAMSQHWIGGKGACKSLRNEFDRMAVFFWRTRTQSGKDFLVYGCANTSLNKLPFALATTSIQTHSHLQSCYPANKEAHFFLFMAVQTQAWTNSLLHVPQPQSKDTFIFTAATHKQRMCLHASRSRISQTVFCTVHVQCTHSARQSARPQNAVNTMGLAFCWPFTKKL